MDTLQLPPLQASYNVGFGTEVTRIQLNGGASFFRRDIIGASSTVNCSWNLSKAEYQYLMAFYRVQVNKASAPFQYRLIIDQADADDYECFFIPGSVQLTSKSGLRFTVTGQLEVKAKLVDLEFDQSIIDSFGSGFGTDAANLLEKLANEDLPNALENA